MSANYQPKAEVCLCDECGERYAKVFYTEDLYCVRCWLRDVFSVILIILEG